MSVPESTAQGTKQLSYKSWDLLPCRTKTEFRPIHTPNTFHAVPLDVPLEFRLSLALIIMTIITAFNIYVTYFMNVLK